MTLVPSLTDWLQPLAVCMVGGITKQQIQNKRQASNDRTAPQRNSEIRSLALVWNLVRGHCCSQRLRSLTLPARLPNSPHILSGPLIPVSGFFASLRLGAHSE